MSQGSEVLVILPEVTISAAAYVESLNRHFDTAVSVVIPSALDGLDVKALQNLRRCAAIVSTFAATPAQLKEKHLEITTRAIVLYELGRIAIPMHYQNLRDQLEREYGMATVRDSQVREILAKSRLIVEQVDDVYKSKERYRSTSARTFLKEWCSLISADFLDGVYDLHAYFNKLAIWFRPVECVEYDGLPQWPVRSCVQVQMSEHVVIIETDERKTEVRCIANKNSGFMANALLSDLFSQFLTPLDEDVVDRLERARAIGDKLLKEPLGREAMVCLTRYADLWMEYIRHQNLRGQEQKWRGWYLVPEHGPLTLDKLWELHRILRALDSRSKSGSCLIDTSDAGIQNVVYLLSAGKVKYQKHYTEREKRSLFIRQQKNYLIRLGLVTELGSSYLSVSESGKTWIDISTELDLRDAYKRVLRELRWAWCNMPFFEFAKEVATICGGYISYRELFNWVIHAYERTQLQEVVMALRTSRGLSDAQRQAVDKAIESKLNSLLERHMSGAALGHYRTKIRDMMEAFATTGDFAIKGDGVAAKIILTARGKDRKKVDETTFYQ